MGEVLRPALLIEHAHVVAGAKWTNLPCLSFANLCLCHPNHGLVGPHGRGTHTWDGYQKKRVHWSVPLPCGRGDGVSQGGARPQARPIPMGLVGSARHG